MRYAVSTRFFILLSSLLCGISCSSSIASRNELPPPDYANLPRFEGRIVNGTKATLGQFPHQVSLRRSYSGSHFCGGSVISDSWILTAAHCMYNRNGDRILPWTITVVAGQIRLNEVTAYTQKIGVESIIVNEKFDFHTLTNDITLLKLKSSLNLDTIHVQPATLGTKMPEPGTECKVSGWGYLAENKPVVSNDLMYVALPLIDSTRCRELLIDITTLPLGMFCAGFEEGLRDACQGDSGGGMICGNTLTGVVSGGEGCARPALPGVYADVPYYLEWILYNIKNYQPEPYVYDKPSTLRVKDRSHNSCPNVSSPLSLYALGAISTMLSYLSLTMSSRV